jgi:hypothetical protein
MPMPDPVINKHLMRMRRVYELELREIEHVHDIMRQKIAQYNRRHSDQKRARLRCALQLL